MRLDTKDKLQEAEYFLSKMDRHQFKRLPFKYNLSAFLSASRSVTFFMKKEFSKKKGFSQWYEKKEEEMKNTDWMVILKDKRTLTIHIKPLEPQARHKITIKESISISDSILIKEKKNREAEIFPVETHIPTPPMTTGTFTEIEWYFDEIPDSDILTVCKKYFQYLESLVDECITLFL